MKVNDAVLSSSEKIVFALRELYLSYGYCPYRMSKFEEYDLYAQNKDFLLSDNVITFNDPSGKLMAMKPDVTLSIIKNSADAPDRTQKVFYNENVYRVSKSTGSFREIMQAGVECFGSIGVSDISEMLCLASESLGLISENAVLAVSDLELVALLVKQLDLSAEKQEALYQAISEKNLPEIQKICQNSPVSVVSTLSELLSLHGRFEDVQEKLDLLFAPYVNADNASFREAYQHFRAVLQQASQSEKASLLQVDFSVISDVNYYNGIVFKGYIRDIPTAVLSGGQYDRLMRRLGRRSCAIGFAVYTDMLDRMELTDAADADEQADFVNIALPKGRLGEKIYDLFAKAGYECPGILDPGRKLIFENTEDRVRYFWVKPSDVAIYVEHGAADIGVVGKDILLESEPEVYELLDLKKGKCRMAVAAPKGYQDNASTLRVATKFSNIAKQFYQSKGRDIDIIHLNGSIEIAPILGLSDVIVDIVETGTTLKENDLEVIDTVVPISARLIANKAAFKFKSRQIEDITAALYRIVEEEK